MIIIDEEKRKKDFFTPSIIIFIVASLIIIGLAGAFYYIVSRPIPSADVLTSAKTNVEPKTVEPKTETPVEPVAEVSNTNVIYFRPPLVLPTDTRQGYCMSTSLAQPYRQDAFRCTVSNQTYDPCFTLASEEMVYCMMNPLVAGSDFLIQLASPLPAISAPQGAKGNWAWFVELEDGTFCAPYTNNRPIANGQEAYYGCKHGKKGEQLVLVGDLVIGKTGWTAQKALFSWYGSSWIVKSLEQVNVKTVWQ